MQPRFLFHPTQARMSGLRLLSERTERPLAQVLRDMIDFCSRQEAVDQMYPHLSGQMLASGGEHAR
jgi:hypothetical protein